jgi:hypothetical protein
VVLINNHTCYKVPLPSLVQAGEPAQLINVTANQHGVAIRYDGQVPLPSLVQAGEPAQLINVTANQHGVAIRYDGQVPLPSLVQAGEPAQLINVTANQWCNKSLWCTGYPY